MPVRGNVNWLALHQPSWEVFLILIPRAALGGVILFLGIAMLKNWVWDQRKFLNREELAAIAMILIVVAYFGYLTGFGLGVMLACIAFVIACGKSPLTSLRTDLSLFSSSVVRHERQRKIINEFGGQIGETYGVPVSEIQEAIKHGVRKINIDTDLRLAATGAIRRFFGEHPAEFDPRSYNKVAKEAMKSICKARFEQFGSAGNASKIKIISLEAMAERYQKGTL